MEEDLDVIFENATQAQLGRLPYYQVRDAVNVTACLIGIIADIVIIYLIAGNKRMRTSTNIILLNLAISDAVVLTMAIFFLWSVLEMLGVLPMKVSSHCMILELESTFQIISTIFVFTLLTKEKIQNGVNRVSLAIFYSAMFFIMTTSVVLCCFGYDLLALPIVAVLLLLFLVATMFTQEIYMCFRCKTFALNGELLLRFNVGRIYTYNWFMCSVLIILMHNADLPKDVVLLMGVLSASGYLCSLYTLIYLACTDKKFKICLRNIFRKDCDRYDVDATIGFTDESSEDAFEEVNIHGDTVQTDIS